LLPIHPSIPGIQPKNPQVHHSFHPSFNADSEKKKGDDFEDVSGDYLLDSYADADMDYCKLSRDPRLIGHV